MDLSSGYSPLDIIAKLSLALNVSADMLIFGQDEKGTDKELYFHFTAISQFSTEEKKIAKSLSLPSYSTKLKC
ncbi:MAG: hypothetical protein FD167_4726 [bacterium]|nr:MAG: hypothetical protein FD167_4726 [bacterium]